MATFNDLQEICDQLVSQGIELFRVRSNSYSVGVYFNDPDGNRIEIYCELLEPLAGKRFLATRDGTGKNFEWDDVLDADGVAAPGLSVLHVAAR